MKVSKNYIIIVSSCVIAAVFITCQILPSLAASDTKPVLMQDIVQTMLDLRDPATGLLPSHYGHPGYEQLAFLYDESVNAIILKITGHQPEAEKIIDYFILRLNIPINEIQEMADTNHVYGILKIIKSRNSPEAPVKTLINTVDITSSLRQGRSLLEFWTTPGPVSFLIFAMLSVNPAKYTSEAVILGDVLLTMQDSSGGITDGDRAPNKIHTEPHMDAYAAFLMLYQTTKDEKWHQAAQKAYNWFEHNACDFKKGIIYQGKWSGHTSAIFAQDVYAWTMSGPAGDKIPLSVLKKMTESMLDKSLTQITVSLPDETTRTVTLCDFTDPKDKQVQRVRGSYHPLGSVEWTGGAVLALKKMQQGYGMQVIKIQLNFIKQWLRS